MPLINCEECGKSVSDVAKACPHCGFPIKKKGKGFAVTSLVLGIIACVYSMGIVTTIFTPHNQAYTAGALAAYIFIFAVLSLIFGIVSHCDGCTLKKKTAGIILSIIAIVLTIVSLVIGNLIK